MHKSTISPRGQTTVPKAIRDAIRAQPGTKLNWQVKSDGRLIVQAKTKSMLELQETPNKT